MFLPCACACAVASTNHIGNRHVTFSRHIPRTSTDVTPLISPSLFPVPLVLSIHPRTRITNNCLASQKTKTGQQQTNREPDISEIGKYT